MIEGRWSALALELKVDSGKIAKLLPHFQKAQETREELLRKSRNDRETIVRGLSEIREELDEKIQEVLLEAEWRKLDAWENPSQPEAPTDFSSPQGPPLANSEQERRMYEIAKQVPRRANVPEIDGRLLRLLTETIGAQHVVEVGTSTGYSALWLCDALRSTGGKLTTFEIDPDVAATARKHLELAGVGDLATIVVGDAHENVTKVKEPIDLLFIDADKDGYSDYPSKLFPLVRPGGLIVSHNMRRPAPNPDFLREITTDPRLETLFFNMDQAGIAVSLKKM